LFWAKGEKRKHKNKKLAERLTFAFEDLFLRTSYSVGVALFKNAGKSKKYQ
jgi:hypothetical protein